jgi:hypothetical protein
LQIFSPAISIYPLTNMMNLLHWLYYPARFPLRHGKPMRARRALLPLPREFPVSHSFPVSPFFATLTKTAQLVENPAILSPVFATLTNFARVSPLFATFYEKPPGVGYCAFQLSAPEIQNFRRSTPLF